MSSPDWASREPGPGRNSSGVLDMYSAPRVYRSRFAMRRAGRRLSTTESRTSSPVPQPGAASPVVQSSDPEDDSPPAQGRLGPAKNGPGGNSSAKKHSRPPTSKRMLADIDIGDGKADGNDEDDDAPWGRPGPAKRSSGGQVSGKGRGRPPSSKRAPVDIGDGKMDDGEEDAGSVGREEARVWQQTYRDYMVPIPLDSPSPSPAPQRALRTRSMSRGRRTTPARVAKASAPVSPEVPVLEQRGRKRVRSATRAATPRKVRETADAPPKVGPPRSKSLRRASSAHPAARAQGPVAGSSTRASSTTHAAAENAGNKAASTFRSNFSGTDAPPSTLPPLPIVLIKRPRGRPRKHPLPEAALSPPAAVIPVLESPPAKRPRGRPRIHPLPDPDTPKRPRGRPPGSKNRRKSEGDADREGERGGYVRSIVDALEGRGSPDPSAARAGQSRRHGVGSARTQENRAFVLVPRAPYALHRRARAPANEDEERELPVAPYDDADSEPAGSVVERHEWVAIQADLDMIADGDDDEETQVEEVLTVPLPRRSAGPSVQDKSTGSFRQLNKAGPKAQPKATEDVPSPAKKQRTSAGQSPADKPSSAQFAPASPLKMQSTPRVQSTPRQTLLTPFSASSLSSLQAGFYTFGLDSGSPVNAQKEKKKKKAPPVSSPASAPVAAAPAPAPALTTAPAPAAVSARPASYSGSLLAPPSMVAPGGMQEYKTVNLLYDALLTHVRRWRATKASFRFQGSWTLGQSPDTVLDEKFVRAIAGEAVKHAQMPFSTHPNHTTVVLRGQTAQIHLLCECSEDWGMARACGGTMSMSLMQTSLTAASAPDAPLDGLRAILEVAHR
ncbi:hypothetical protein DAEQUDRAFT_598642 [Daedalea quercina L-15889]|uniref:Uncharacterized protein n=1 Tax=Daedalea quercina L-15889 TaxID=1314783 RepID=A0A165LPH4_9APHY|nr:hypothetical protein DAEQUDRAFT_598642 [Daedalea quercina L-15889]